MANVDGSTQEPNAEGSDTPEPQYVTEDRLAAVVNAAVSNHLKRSLGTAISSVLSKELEPLKQRLAEAPKAEAEEKSAGKGPDPMVAALQKQLADMQSAMRAAQEEAAAEKRRGREQSAYAALKSELSGKVRPEALDAAADLLFHARKRVVIDEEGNTSFIVKTSMGKGLPEEDREFPLADGVREFLKSKEAALFIPSPGGATANGARPAALKAPSAPNAMGHSFEQLSDDQKAQHALSILMQNGLEIP